MLNCRYAISLLLLTIAAGCAATKPENLPPYRWVDAPTALHDLCERSVAVKTVSSEATLFLTRNDGQSVRLDGAIVMKLPTSVRMRAWKFGQAVFDLTLTPEGLWVDAPKDPNRRDQVMPASISAGKMAKAWSVMSGEFFCSPDLKAAEAGPATLRVEGRIDGQRVMCEVDRETLTPRKYTVVDAGGVERFTLTLERYEVVSGIVWPVKLKAKSEGGLIYIELKGPELNGEIAPNAFVPPKRAEKIP